MAATRVGFYLESDLSDKLILMLANFNVEKIKLISFNHSNNSGIGNVKVDESMINEKPYFKMQRLSFSSKLYWGS